MKPQFGHTRRSSIDEAKRTGIAILIWRLYSKSAVVNQRKQ